MNSKSFPLLIASCTLVVSTLLAASCASNDELKGRMDQRTDTYKSFQDRREIRQDARDERDRAWFDRVLN